MTYSKAHLHFKYNIKDLIKFYNASIYAYEQTEGLLIYRKKNKIKFDEVTIDGLLIKNNQKFPINNGYGEFLRKSLCETIFIRLVSALEVFLIDLVKDAFVINKDFFKDNNKNIAFNQAEVLSISTPSELFAKIINKETRGLSSGGFIEVIKFYNKTFGIQLADIKPGKFKMQEYHDRRHLLVHRLGKVDNTFRKKYNYSKNHISIDESYLMNCVQDFMSFANEANQKLLKKVSDNTISTREKKIEKTSYFKIQILDLEKNVFFNKSYEFWSYDEFCSFTDIVDDISYHSENEVYLRISGTSNRINSYKEILKTAKKRKIITYEHIIEPKSKKSENTSFEYQEKYLYDDTFLEKVRGELPPQPWETGIHKVVAERLLVSNKVISTSIRILIEKGIFKNQVNGKLQ